MVSQIDQSIHTSSMQHRTLILEQELFAGKINLSSNGRGCIRCGSLIKVKAISIAIPLASLLGNNRHFFIIIIASVITAFT